MIGWLRGSVLSWDVGGEVLVDVHGVGYRVHVPTPTLTSVSRQGGDIEFHVHTHVREDAIVLYGFTTLDERRCFEALLGAHGVGPSLALAVLSALSPAALARAVAEEDVDALCSVPGIGRKTAARLVLDLTSRLTLPEIGAAGDRPGAGTSVRGEVRSALGELGYGSEEIRWALEALPSEGSVEDLLRFALRELAASR